MTEWTRREWVGRILGGLAAAVPAALKAGAKPAVHGQDARIRNVTIGVRGASFRERNLDEALQSLKALGVGACALWSGHIEPKELNGPRATREQLRRWRLSTPLEDFQAIRAKCAAAGVAPLAYDVELASDYTEAELERVFLVAETMGIGCVTSPGGPALIGRVARFAREHRVRLALVNQAEPDPDRLVTADDIKRALAGTGEEIGIALDLGAAAAAGADGLALLKQHWKRVVVVHLSDRKRGQTASVALGSGDAQLAAALRVLRDQHLPIPALIESAARGGDPLDELQRRLAYCRQTLEG
jgi:sugar phosphate isomerase/epimerase